MTDFSLDDYLWQLRHASSAEVRRNAAFILGRDRDPRAIPALLHALNDADESVRVRVVEALGTRDDPQIVDALIPRLNSADSTEVRRMIARSLGFLGDARASEALSTALHDPASEVRVHVAEALGKLNNPAVIPALIQALIHDSDAEVRYFVKESLILLGKAGHTAELRALLTEGEPSVLVDALELVTQVADTQALPAVEALRQHADESVQAMAEWASQTLQRPNRDERFY